MTGDSVRVGAGFPQLEIKHDAAQIRAWAEAVDDLGYADISVTDHVLGFRNDPAPSIYGPIVPETSLQEPFVLFGISLRSPSVSRCRPASWCCHNGRPPWSPNRLPRLTC